VFFLLLELSDYIFNLEYVAVVFLDFLNFSWFGEAEVGRVVVSGRHLSTDCMCEIWFTVKYSLLYIFSHLLRTTNGNFD